VAFHTLSDARVLSHPGGRWRRKKRKNIKVGEVAGLRIRSEKGGLKTEGWGFGAFLQQSKGGDGVDLLNKREREREHKTGRNIMRAGVNEQKEKNHSVFLRVAVKSHVTHYFTNKISSAKT